MNNRMTYRIVQDIRSQAIRHIQEACRLSYLDQHSTGDIVSRVIADTDILSDGLLLGFTQLFSGIVTIVVTLIFMFSKNVWVTLLVIVLTPFSFVVAKFISSRSYTMFRKQSETRGRQTALIEEMIGGQKVVKAFGYEKESSRRFDEINKELQTYSQKAVFYSSFNEPIYTICQQYHLRRSSTTRSFSDTGRNADGWRTFCTVILCEPVYEAV